MLSLLTTLASFSLKNPKTIMIGAAVFGVVMFGLHYTLLVGERDKLRVAEAGYERAISAFTAREATLKEDILLERQAAAIALSERNDARMVLEFFRSSRQDAPSIAWASLSIPEAEMKRLCAALPRASGCFIPNGQVGLPK